MTQPLQYELTGGIATLRMDDGKANAFSPAMIAALSRALDRAAHEADAVIIAGRDGLFCAGFDLKVMRGNDAAAREAMRAAGRKLLETIYLYPLPVVMACTGHALAAGALLLLTGDVRIGATGDYKIGLNETAIGLALPPYGLELARDRLDPRQLTNAVVAAAIYDPPSALGAGYLDDAVAPDDLDTTAQAAARRLTALDKATYGATKRRLRQPTIERIAAASS